MFMICYKFSGRSGEYMLFGGVRSLPWPLRSEGDFRSKGERDGRFGATTDDAELLAACIRRRVAYRVVRRYHHAGVPQLEADVRRLLSVDSKPGR